MEFTELAPRVAAVSVGRVERARSGRDRRLGPRQRPKTQLIQFLKPPCWIGRVDNSPAVVASSAPGWWRH